MTDILKVENVTLQFCGVKAITDISFNVKEGEICAILVLMVLEKAQCLMS